MEKNYLKGYSEGNILMKRFSEKLVFLLLVQIGIYITKKVFYNLLMIWGNLIIGKTDPETGETGIIQ